MEKIRNSNVLKIISYILIPLLVLAIIMGVIYIKYNSYNKEDMTREDYYKTDAFVYNEYYNHLQRIFRICDGIETAEKSNEYIQINYNYMNIGYMLVREVPEKVYYNQSYNSFKYIIIDSTGTVYTNIQTDNYKGRIQEIRNGKHYWYKENETINTDLEQINENGLSYTYGLENLKELKNNGYYIYSYLDKDEIVNWSYATDEAIYNFIINIGEIPIYVMIISIIMLFIITIYLIWSIGHSKNKEGIYLDKFDEFPYELIVLGAITIITIGCSIISTSIINTGIYSYISLLIAYFICYVPCAILGITTIKRIKAETIIKSTLTYMIFKWFKTKVKNIINAFVLDKPTVTKLIIYYIAFLTITCILISMIHTGIGLILLLVFWSWSFYRILKYTKQVNYIQRALKDIYEGKEDIKIENQNLETNLKKMAEYINSISNGLTSAVEKSLKSERMKTELITNVSHDIKTPLTSIINYVDLLKKEKMPSKKAQEYLEILDQKSQRLKRLTEDLVEASKASSGNIKLNIEKINVKELINQISGEYEDKLKENELELVLQIPKQETIINADSRYLYRVIENMYSNIVKYALKGSRVYIDILNNNDKVRIELKNISKEKLNISADELMQRFVRGETSRNTEGSGLGLSIAESLTKLQGGNFSIYLDGDLFKVIIEFDK